MDFMASRALIETGVISILFVFHAAPQAYLCYTGTFMEMSALKKESTEMYPISLKGAQIYCEDHPGKTTEGNVRRRKKKKGSKRKQLTDSVSEAKLKMKNVHYMPVKVKGSHLLAAAVKMSTSPSLRAKRGEM